MFAILELDSQEARARKLVSDFYRQESRWEELVSAHLRFSEDSNEKDERLANLYQACELVEDVIVDHEQAVALWQQVLEEDPVTIELSQVWSVSILYSTISRPGVSLRRTV